MTTTVPSWVRQRPIAVSTIAVSTVAVSIISIACADMGSVAVDSVRRDSAGVEIVENPGAVWTDATAWRLSDEPRLRIGTFDGAPELQLYQVAAGLLLDDGRVVVANSGSQELRFYTPGGQHLVSHGGDGEGPGEFRTISRAQRLGGDTIRVYDFRTRRLFDLTPEGFIASITLRPPEGARAVSYLGTAADGSMLAQALVTPDLGEIGMATPSRRSVGTGRTKPTARRASRSRA